MRYLVVGKDGFIATRFIEYFKKNECQYAVTTRGTPSNENEYRLCLGGEDAVPDDIIDTYTNILFLASISSPDICNKDYDYAHSVNVSGTKNFIQRCLNRNARVLFFSSDTVYGETELAVDECSVPKPFGGYASMKHEIEKIFTGITLFKSMRMSYVISDQDKFTTYLRMCCKKDLQAQVYHPLYRNSIWIDDVLEATMSIFHNWQQHHNQYFNISGPELLSRIDIAQIYKRVVNPKLNYYAFRPEETFYSARPKKIELKFKLLKKILGRNPVTISEAYGFQTIN